jgi:membrane protein required for colicin V production
VFVDILLIFFLFGAVTLGFFGGLIRGIVVVIMFYLSMVLASLYFTSLGMVVETRYPTMSPEIARLTSFLWLLFMSFVLLTIAGVVIFRHIRLPKRFRHIDRIGGVVVGLLLALFVSITFSVVLWNMMILKGGNTSDFPLIRWFGKSVEHSFIVQYIANSISANMSQALAPFLPGGAEVLFMTTE